MEKISILIASKDGMYNEALAAAFLDINKNISVFTMPFENAVSEVSEALECYDVILLEEDSKEIKAVCVNTVILTEKKVFTEEHQRNFIYKYQKSEDILNSLLKKYKKTSLENIKKDVRCDKTKDGKSSTLSVGVVSVSEGKNCEKTALFLAKTMADSGIRTVYFDLREFQNDEGIRIKKDGSRSWDDLIYCCVYGKSRDLLLYPEDHASEEESGLMLFKSSKGRNPFYDLNDDEADELCRILKDELNSEIYICSINYADDQGLIKAVKHCNIIIIAGDVKDHNNCESVKKELDLRENCFEEIITVCCRSKEENDSGFDFYISFDEDRLTNDLLRISGYIDRYRWEHKL